MRDISKVLHYYFPKVPFGKTFIVTTSIFQVDTSGPDSPFEEDSSNDDDNDDEEEEDDNGNDGCGNQQNDQVQDGGGHEEQQEPGSFETYGNNNSATNRELFNGKYRSWAKQLDNELEIVPYGELYISPKQKMLQTATCKPLKVYYRKKSLPKATHCNSKESIKRSPRFMELFDGSRPSYNKDGILTKKKTTKKLPPKLTFKILKTSGDDIGVPSVDIIEAHLNQPHIVPTYG